MESAINTNIFDTETKTVVLIIDYLYVLRIYVTQRGVPLQESEPFSWANHHTTLNRSVKVGYTQWRKKKAFLFKNNCNFFIFNKKNMLTPKQPVINAVLITYVDYSITENYIGKMASFLPYTRPEPLLKVLHHIY